MAAGFIVLPDGRCFSRRWSAHDVVVRAVAEAVSTDSLRLWLLSQLPGPEDEEELGYGAWGRASDGSSVRRFIDLRLMTEQNQKLFCDAVKRAALVRHEEKWLVLSLNDFADMVERMERGESPLSKSDWQVVVPPRGERIGPGWSAT